MTFIGRLTTALLLTLAALLPTGVLAQDLADADRAAIRMMIADQIEAFRRDDADGAYGFAAPDIKRMFPTPERFMEMVRNQYRPVYRPRSVAFGEATETAGGALQKVFLTGPDGRGWLAAYLAERQEDGSWRISGCALSIDDASPGI